MLKEDGYVFDDGVCARISPTLFHVTTTTGGAPRVLAHMEDYLQTEWPDLKVYLTSITEQWAVIAVQGRNARDIIAPLVDDIALDDASFPHMAVRIGHIAGVPCRLFRVSFTGELGFEINVPSDYGRAVWEAVYESGKRFDIAPYGTEAMHVLRAEKGFIIVGQETDGTVTPDDLGLGGLVGKAKRGLCRQARIGPARCDGARPQAACRLAHRKLVAGARRGRSDRGQSEPAGADEDDRPRHVQLYERQSRPLDRARHGGRRPQPHQRAAARDHARGGSPKRR